MRRGTPLDLYLRAARAENAAQFVGRYTKGANSFYIAVNDVKRLQGVSNIVNVEPLSGFSSQATIITRHNRHKELFVDVSARDYRNIHLAFFEQIGVAADASRLRGFDSDHVYPRSAALAQGVHVAMNLVQVSANRSWGSGWEKRLTHDRLGSPLKRGELAALLKTAGVVMADARDPVRTLRAGIDDLIKRGDVSTSSLGLMVARLEECLREKQTQDENYAVATGQVDLSPDAPL
jgi:hypothetical protein